MAAPSATASSGLAPSKEIAEHAGDRAAHDRHARGAADQNDFLELVDIDVAIAQRPNDRISEPGEEAQAQALELIASRRVRSAGHPGNDHCRPFRGAQLPPRPLCLLAQQLVQHGVLLARREAHEPPNLPSMSLISTSLKSSPPR